MTPDAALAPTSRRHPALALGLTCTATSMVGLDVAIVNVALPSIRHDLGVAQGSLQFVVVAYGLLLGGFLLVGGRATDLLGRRRVLLAGLALFTAASVLAGAAQTPGVLIAARGAQGLGGALVAPAALSLLAVTFGEGRERNRALGVLGAVGGIAGTFGVVVGGLLAAGPGWRWAFFVNVPVGVVLIGLAVTIVAPDGPRRRDVPLDLPGACAITAGLLLSVGALHHAGTHGWSSPGTLAWGAAAVATVAAFVRIESRAAAPLVPRRWLANRTLVAANGTAFLTFGVFFSFIFVGTLLMQQGLGWSPVRTGVAWLATTATEFVTACLAGRVAADVGVRRLVTVGLALLGLGVLWLTRIPAEADLVVDLLPAFLLAGLGFGLCGPALQIGALSGVTSSESGVASGLVETMREVGAAAGVAAVSTVLVAGAGPGGFRTAFAAIGLLAALGVVVAAVGFGAESDRQGRPVESGQVRSARRTSASSRAMRRGQAGPP